MTEPRSGISWLYQSVTWRKKIKVVGLCLMWMILAIDVVSCWEEGDDAVNVISVENMDAILGLRMVGELRSFEGFKTNETDIRSKRMVYFKQKNFPFSDQVSVLCSRNECNCTSVGTGYTNISCDFKSDGNIDISPGSVPVGTFELRVCNAKLLRIMPGAFDHPYLGLVSLHKLKNLRISTLAFQNLSYSPFNLEIKDCGSVILEEHSFRNLQSPVKASIENCERVVLKKSILSWLLVFKITNVPNLELVENTFSVEVKQNPDTTDITILFQNVSVNEIPKATFPLSAAKINFVDCDLKTINSGAFNAILLASVNFERTKLERLQNGAFSERTLIQNVEFFEADIKLIESNALSAVGKFTIQNSRIEEVTSGAFNVNTAYLKLLGNDFRKIRRYAFQIQNWNSIKIEGNRFEYLEPDCFSASFSNSTKIRHEFLFSNNSLKAVEVDVLSFVPNESDLDVEVSYNIFEEACHCHLETWIRKRSPQKWESFYETSFCVITDLLEKCYNLTKGYMNMKEYTEDVCTPENVIVCEDIKKNYRPNILMPFDLQNTERTVLGVIFLGVICSVAIMLTILSLIWMKQKGICSHKRKSSNSGFFFMCSRLCNNGNLVATNSISRINIHEYAEIQNQLNQQQKQTILAVEEDGSDDEDLIMYENKATQTLPEELTQELLQSLREKLEDPENYNEARDMIEHLYDLIKVEESCNNNNVSPRTSLTVEEEDDEFGGIYEVIKNKKPSLNRTSKPKKKGLAINVTSTGTRAPSPDKLSPISFKSPRPLPTVVNDYIEPRDRKSNEYCELPANLSIPDVLKSSQIKSEFDVQKPHIYAEPFQYVPSKQDQPGTSKS